MEAENSSDQPAENAVEDPVGVMFTDAFVELDRASKAAILKFSKDATAAMAQLRAETSADIAKLREKDQQRVAAEEDKFRGMWQVIRDALGKVGTQPPDIAVGMFVELFKSIDKIVGEPCTTPSESLELSTRILMRAIMEADRNTRAAAELVNLVKAGLHNGLHTSRQDFRDWLVKFENAHT